MSGPGAAGRPSGHPYRMSLTTSCFSRSGFMTKLPAAQKQDFSVRKVEKTRYLFFRRKNRVLD